MEFGGLPYDENDAAAAVAAEAAAAAASTTLDAEGDHPMLDRPLDDFIVPNDERRGSRERAPREPVPEHVQSLIGRMGKGKVYLVDESPAIIHRDGEERIRRDPRLSRLAEELDRQDPTSWLEAISETAASPIRPTALYVSSELIKHLSTAKVFTWTSELGAAAMGIEWLNDSTLILLFRTAADALLGLSMIAKAGFDPTEGDDPLLERAAHSFPPSLLPQRVPSPERWGRDSRSASPQKRGSGGRGTRAWDDDAELPDEGGPVRRRGRGAFNADGGARSRSGSPRRGLDEAPPAPTETRFVEGVDPHARVTVRYATAADAELRRTAGQSEWYARHGRTAGKEVAPRRNLRGYGHDEPLSLRDRVGTSGEGREFASRIRGRRYDPRDGDREPRERRRPNVSDLDADLDSFAARRDGRDDEWTDRREDRRGGGGRGARGGRQPRARQEDLDRELEEMFSARREE